MINSTVFRWFLCIPLLSSCIDEPHTPANTYRNNFESLWQIIDRQYCFLDEKNIDWDSVYTVYNARLAQDTVSELVFFDAMAEMLAVLKDGHVNLLSSFDRSRYWNFFTDYPSNFNSSLVYSDRYLGKNYRLAGALRYQRIAGDSVGYLYYPSFGDGFSDSNMRYVMKYFENCRGLIIDVRNNGGGSADLSTHFASYFFDKDTVNLYLRHKQGPGHSDLSDPVGMPLKAHPNLQWRRPVIVLANRSSYSATNLFIARMKDAPNARILGDRSGGGGGMPSSNELPNGWMVRFSSSPMYDAALRSIEGGIEPDVKVVLEAGDVAKGEDTLIEEGVRRILSKE